MIPLEVCIDDIKTNFVQQALMHEEQKLKWQSMMVAREQVDFRNFLT